MSNNHFNQKEGIAQQETGFDDKYPPFQESEFPPRKEAHLRRNRKVKSRKQKQKKKKLIKFPLVRIWLFLFIMLILAMFTYPFWVERFLM